MSPKDTTHLQRYIDQYAAWVPPQLNWFPRDIADVLNAFAEVHDLESVLEDEALRDKEWFRSVANFVALKAIEDDYGPEYCEHYFGESFERAKAWFCATGTPGGVIFTGDRCLLRGSRFFVGPFNFTIKKMNPGDVEDLNEKPSPATSEEGPCEDQD